VLKGDFMHEQDDSILRALVPIAWADGSFGEREQQLFSALLDAYEAKEPERTELLAYAAQKRELSDISLDSLSSGDRRTVLHHACMMVHADDKVDDAEAKMLEELATALRISGEEAAAIQTIAKQRLAAHKNAG
jgi:uncharacterized tellurite resistance protein B-like protein